jgi:hypothetical protein
MVLEFITFPSQCSHFGLTFFHVGLYVGNEILLEVESTKKSFYNRTIKILKVGKMYARSGFGGMRDDISAKCGFLIHYSRN